MTVAPDTADPPRVAVVIATFRRPDLLARCLEALGGQDLPRKDWEVIIADDAASEATRAQVEESARTVLADVAVRYLAITATHGPAAARNAGWRAARGEIIAFTDDDCLPEAGWLNAGVRAFDDPALDASGGQIIVPLPPEPTDHQRDAAGLEGAEFATANAWSRRAALGAVGGFDERFTVAWREDSDLQFALLTGGFSVGRVPEAVVVHPVRPACWGVSLGQQRKSQFDALLYRNFPRLYRARISAGPPWGYYLIVLSLAVAAGAGGLRAWPVAGGALVGWLILTARFAARRIWPTSKRPRHVAEMVVTSALIPPLAIFWRLRGAIRYRVWFA